MEEPILIEESMQHAGVDLLFLRLWRLLERNHRLDQLLNFSVNFIILSGEYFLEVFVCSGVNCL